MSGPNELPLIRLAEKDDCAEILRLIQELADYEKMSDGPKIGADGTHDDYNDADIDFTAVSTQFWKGTASAPHPASSVSSLRMVRKPSRTRVGSDW